MKTRRYYQTVRGGQKVQRRERGTALVEFMIVSPFLFLILFAGAEFGRLVQHHETLIKTVRNAARYTAEETAGSLGVVVLSDALVNRTKNLAVRGHTGASGDALLPGLDPSNITVSQPVPLHVQVTADYTYQPLWGGSIPTFGLGSGPITLTLDMSATSIMRSL